MSHAAFADDLYAEYGELVRTGLGKATPEQRALLLAAEFVSSADPSELPRHEFVRLAALALSVKPPSENGLADARSLTQAMTETAPWPASQPEALRREWDRIRRGVRDICRGFGEGAEFDIDDAVMGLVRACADAASSPR